MEVERARFWERESGAEARRVSRESCRGLVDGPRKAVLSKRNIDVLKNLKKNPVRSGSGLFQGVKSHRKKGRVFSRTT